MINPKIAKMRTYTAARKTQLFSSLGRPITADLTIGEPQHEPDREVVEILNKYAAEAVGRYPKTRQEPFLTDAIVEATRRSRNLTGSISPEQVLAGCGSGELLYSFASACLDPEKPYILIPNPAYQVYSSATELAGGIPYFFNLTKENNFQPDFGRIPQEILARTSLCYLNTPNNPCAVSYSKESLREVLLLARRHGFAVASDECYSEIYIDTRPTSFLEVCAELDGDNSFKNVVAFDTLSKRSSLPGVRSGAMIGDAALVSNYFKIRLSERKVLPLNVQRASAYAWTNFNDVERSRDLYREKFVVMKESLEGIGRNPSLPDGTFYCWMDISDLNRSDEAFAFELAKATGILTFPGSYFSVESEGRNPGAGFIRLALIDTVAATKATLVTFADYIETYGSNA